MNTPTRIQIRPKSPERGPAVPNTPARTPKKASETGHSAETKIDTLEQPDERRSRATWQERRTRTGQSPDLQGLPARKTIPRAAPPRNTPVHSVGLTPGDAPLGATEPVDSGAQEVSSISQLKTENGVLSFILHIPPSKPGEVEQAFRISVLGGQRAELEMLNASDMAAHLTKAIALVQTDPKLRGFSAITFESRLSDDILAKAVVHHGKTSHILGGNRNDRVSGSDKIFSDELQTLLNRLQETLAARHGHLRVERQHQTSVRPTRTPPPTPATHIPVAQTPVAPAELHAQQTPVSKAVTPAAVQQDRPHMPSDPEGMEGFFRKPKTTPSEAVPRAATLTPTPKKVEIDSDSDTQSDFEDTYHDALEDFEKPKA